MTVGIMVLRLCPDTVIRMRKSELFPQLTVDASICFRIPGHVEEEAR